MGEFFHWLPSLDLLRLLLQKEDALLEVRLNANKLDYHFSEQLGEQSEMHRTYFHHNSGNIYLRISTIRTFSQLEIPRQHLVDCKQISNYTFHFYIR